MEELGIWSVFDRDGRLVLGLSDEPGEFVFTRPVDDACDEVPCPFASLQCFQTSAEPELLRHMARAHDLEDFLDTLRAHGFRVLAGRPQPRRFARL